MARGNFASDVGGDMGPHWRVGAGVSVSMSQGDQPPNQHGSGPRGELNS